MFESPVVWTEKRLKPNWVRPITTELLVAVVDSLGKWQLQSVSNRKNS